MTEHIKLTPFGEVFPEDNSLISCKGYSILLISNLHQSGGATGIVQLVYHDQMSKLYQISELLSITIEITCVGFHFLSPGISTEQEIKFIYQLFH